MINPSVSTVQTLHSPDVRQMIPITFGYTSTYAHTILNFNGTSLLPQQFNDFHQLSQADYTKTCQELDTLILKNYAYEERKELFMRIAAIVSLILLLPIIGFFIYYAIDELFLKKKRDAELRENMQRILDDHNARLYNPKGVSLVLDVGLTLNSFSVPIESWEIKVVSHRVQLPPANQTLASPVKLYETRCSYNRECRLFNPSIPASIKDQYQLGDEWEKLVKEMNAISLNNLQVFFQFVTAPLYWSVLVSSITLFLALFLFLPFFLIYVAIIYFVKLKPEEDNMRNVKLPQLVKEYNEKYFLPKGLRIALDQNKVRTAHVDTLYLAKQ